MKVLQVGKFYYPYKGGMETYLFDLCQGLKKGVDLKILVSNTAMKTVRETVKEIEVIRAGRWGRVAATSFCPAFPFLLRRLAGDIVQVQHPDPLSALSYLLAHPGGKLIVVYQSDIIRQKLTELLYRPFLFKFLGKADRIIVTSPQYLESSPTLRKFKEKCVIIPIGIDLSRYEGDAWSGEKTEQIRKMYGRRIVLFIGRLALYKGLDYLVEAMKNVDASLLIIGTGEREKPLKRVVSQRGLDERVFFLGEVSEDDLPHYLHACSVFCLPSVTRNEAFGVCQLEAMACSKPVVSTRLDTGVTFVNQNGETGMVLPPRDSAALAGALNRLLDCPDLARKMGKNGRARVEALFRREKMVESTMRLFKELLS